MKNAVDIFNEISQHGKSSADNSCRYVRMTAPGDYSAQGDINLWLLADLPPSAKSAPANLQLAPGNSRGSRHCIASEDAHLVEFYALPTPNPLQGNILKLRGDVRIEHPEHGHQILAPGIYLVTYQRRFADELKRVQD